MTRFFLFFMIVLVLGLVGCSNQSPGIAAEVLMSEETAVEPKPEDGPQTAVPGEIRSNSPETSPSGSPGTSGQELVDQTVGPDTTSAPASLPGILLFAFEDGEPGWYTVDDSVMGGVSSSSVAVTEPGVLSFSGKMSLENNGGFSSVRSEWAPVDLSGADGMLLRVWGDGKTYRLRIRTAEAGPEISYNGLFSTRPDSWQMVFVPFASMVPTYRGFEMDVGALNPASIGSFGFMLSDKQPGEFGLKVDWLRAVSEAELGEIDDVWRE